MADQVWGELHGGTPTVVVKASTARTALTLGFLRHPNEVFDGIPARILPERNEADMAARTERLFGPRPLENDEGDLIADAISISALSGQPLSLRTVDGDTSLTLNDVAGRPLWGCNAQGTATRTLYEPSERGGRPLSVIEQPCSGQARTRECFLYGACDVAHVQRNLVGVVIVHHDNGGKLRTLSAALTGQVLETQLRLLCPDAQLPDWDAEGEQDLEAQVLTVTASRDAVGAQLKQTNAANVITITAYDISGAVAQTQLGGFTVLEAVVRLASGEPLSQVAGNGVVDTYVYAPRTHRLTQHRTARPTGHRLGALIICDLHYAYDPVGNILALNDHSVDPTWYRNAVTSGQREYTYDTLYRLASATGRERSPVTLDPMQYAGRAGASVWRRYTECYTYDDGNNLTSLRHNGGSGIRTRNLVVSARSNRAMVQGHELTPDMGFLPGGLQKQLADGRQLSWLADNQLQQVRLVSRDVEEVDDTERYHYANGGTRTRKIHSVKNLSGMQKTVTTYAGACEIRQRWLGDQQRPQKHVVITETETVRWLQDRLSGDDNLRFLFCDHLRSSGGETDCDGKIIAREEYAPYGETTGVDEEAVEASSLSQRTFRHAGKERDATGLYYYGWRYFQPAEGRWLSADPGGLIDGSNLYRMVKNNPLGFRDSDGLSPDGTLSSTDKLAHDSAALEGERVVGIGLNAIREKDVEFANGLSQAWSEAMMGILYTLEVLRQIKDGVAEKETSDVVDKYFFQRPGETLSPGHLSDLVKGFESMLHVLNELPDQGIVGVTSTGSPAAAWTNEEDVTPRIYIKNRHRDDVYMMRWLIVHEVSHLAIGTKDMWYVNGPVRDSDIGNLAFENSLDGMVSGQQLLVQHGAVRRGAKWSEVDEMRFILGDADYIVDRHLNNADSVTLFNQYVNQRLGGPLKYGSATSTSGRSKRVRGEVF
ncbi:RHS repeat-associated core domain-containing protein [Pseudomonas sp. NPDC089752]|uniref:RHS repeat-associated core domain-containing protein n=1 Tax=Pseudomonas sp. NPDC089752 TaxID=3364472 RepID=UPI00380BCF91